VLTVWSRMITDDIERPMTKRTLPALAALAAGAIALAAPAFGQDSGMLRTMPHGIYECALPGDAGGVAYQVVEEEQFRLRSASSYRSSEGTGTYIMRGSDLTFTRGPKKGQKFRKVGANQLQIINADGELGRLICTRLIGSR